MAADLRPELDRARRRRGRCTRQYNGDQSDYVTQIGMVLKARVPIIRQSCKASKHFREFCTKFAEYGAAGGAVSGDRSAGLQRRLMRSGGGPCTNVSTRLGSARAGPSRRGFLPT